MRKNNNLLAVMAFAAVLFVGCAQEENYKIAPVDKSADIIGFRLPNMATRSEMSNETLTGVTIPISDNENGGSFVLEESIQYLGTLSGELATRGTPAYTENVAGLWGAFNAVVQDEDNNQIFGDGAFTYADGDWTRRFYQDPWKDADPLYFYMRMPAEMVGVTLAEDAYELTTDGKQTITFEYISPENAESQEDILFAARPITKQEYADSLAKDKYPYVLFNHALTGVKFAIGNTKEDIEANSIKITEVVFNNLRSKGTCVMTPAKENNYKDDITNFTSAGAASWTLEEDLASFSSGTFEDTVYFAKGGNFGAKDKIYPDSYAAAGNKANLNKADGSQTFWLIPQTISDKVTLTIKYTVNEQDYEWTVDFGKVIKLKTGSNITWNAGELRTYTIKIDDVNVMIEDNVDIVGPKDVTVTPTSGDPFIYKSYEGSSKSNVSISNTGNTDAYIRAALIGQWLDENGDPVFGFTDYTAQQVVLVDSWYQDQFVNKTFKHGKFEGLVGYDSNYSGNWVYDSTDGYYYYTQVVPAGESIPSNDPLFTKYTVGEAPAVAVAGQVKNIYFVLEVATQAISAKKADGTYYTYTEAWTNANAQE